MKIMYVVSNLEKCGPINVVFNIIKKLSIQNDCIIITLSPENNKSMLYEFEKLDVKIIQLKMERNTKKEIYKTELKRIVEDIEPDIIHSHGYRADRYINLINKDCDFYHVTTLHNFPFSDYPRLYGLIPGMMLSISHLCTIKRIKHKIACSYSIAKMFGLFNFDEVSVIQNGVDIETYKLLSKEKKSCLRKKLNLPLDKKIVISTGAIIKRKRPIKLMKAFRNAKWKDENVLFLVLGDGKLYKKLERYSAENIKVLGSKNNIFEYLQVSDVFISNSKAEGLPMAMLEAISTGLIIVGSDISSHREVEKFYKDRIKLFKGQKINSINNKISEALIECESSLHPSGENRYKISCENMANNYLEYYQSLKVF